MKRRWIDCAFLTDSPVFGNMDIATRGSAPIVKWRWIPSSDAGRGTLAGKMTGFNKRTAQANFAQGKLG